MSKVTQDYEWLKKSNALCKWNDPGIEDYDEEDRGVVKQQTYEIISIAYEDDTNTIYDDTIILIGNQDSEIEVYASELEEFFSMEKNLFEQCVEYVYNNFNTMRFDIRHTYSQMCINRTPLKMEDDMLYNHLMDLVEDFGVDNDLDNDWYEYEMIDIEDVFDKLLEYFD